MNEYRKWLKAETKVFNANEKVTAEKSAAIDEEMSARFPTEAQRYDRDHPEMPLKVR